MNFSSYNCKLQLWFLEERKNPWRKPDCNKQKIQPPAATVRSYWKLYPNSFQSYLKKKSFQREESTFNVYYRLQHICDYYNQLSDRALLIGTRKARVFEYFLQFYPTNAGLVLRL